MEEKEIIPNSTDEYIEKNFVFGVLTLVFGSLSIAFLLLKLIICGILVATAAGIIAVPIVWFAFGVFPTLFAVASLIMSSILKKQLELCVSEPNVEGNDKKFAFMKLARKLGFIFGLVGAILL